jgi:hypothetical protein
VLPYVLPIETSKTGSAVNIECYVRVRVVIALN